MGVIAEGVETSEHVSKLRNLNCNLVQGFLFSKPVPAQLASAFLEKKDNFAGLHFVPQVTQN